MEKTANSTTTDGFGCVPSKSLQGLSRSAMMTVTTMAVISLLLLAGVAAAAEWVRPERFFLRQIETPQCAGGRRVGKVTHLRPQK